MANTVFITGASSGIGKATALYFQQQGWQVAATMRRPHRGEDLAALPGVCVYPLDVTDRTTIATAIAHALLDFKKIDVLVNNAGYGLVGPFELATEPMIQQQFDTNVFGVFRTTAALLPHLREHGGTIINVTSIGGLITMPFNSIYHATKFALDGYSASLHHELQPFGIRVKMVAPGAVATDFLSRSLEMTATPDEAGVYSEALSQMLARFQGDEVQYADAPAVAQVIYEAATDGKEQLRYLAGDDAHGLWAAYQQMGIDEFAKLMRSRFFPGVVA